MTEEVMEDRWDPFLDAFAQVREATIAYDALCADVIDELPKTKREIWGAKLKTLREEFNG